MRNIKPYKLFESQSDLDLFISEVDSYLITLKDSNFDVEVNRLIGVDEYVYVCIINEKKSRQFLWKDIKNDIHQYLKMSEFTIRSIVYDSDGLKRRNEEVISTMLELKDDQKIYYIELYLTK